MLKVKIKKLRSNAIIPKYSNPGDAGMDLTVTSILSDNSDEITYTFGLSMEIPEGYVGLIFPRSSIKRTHLSLSNSVGVIDSGYRGEIMACFRKTHNFDPILKYVIGDRAAQIIIVPYPQVLFEEQSELSDSVRGEKGYGSTGN